VDIKLTYPQTEFFEAKEKYVATVAGFGSGKTNADLIRMINNMSECPGLHQAYLAPTYSLIRDIWYPKVDEMLGDMGFKYKINKSENIVHINGLGKVFCRTMEKPETIVGWEVGDAFLDEFDVLKTDKAIHLFRKISARLRKKNNTGRKNQLFVSTTPEGFKATYKLFKKDPLPDSRIIKMSTYSNAHNLPDGYIDDLKAQYPKQLIEAYINGEFVNLQEGTVYYAFDRKECNTHYVPKPREPILVGMDFNVNDMCAVAHIKRDGKLFAIDEFFGLRDTPDMCDALNEVYPDRRITVYPDASGRGTSSKSASMSDLKIIKSLGIIVKAKSKNPFIKDRVNAMNAKFERKTYLVNCERCPEYAEALEQQVYNENTGQPLKDGTIDNRVDGSGYLVNYLYPLQKPVITERRLGGL
jgi:hypothetical protein